MKNKRRINRKKQRRRILFLSMLFISIVLIFFLNFTRFRLAIKGYDFESQNILLSLEKEKIHDYLNHDTVIDLSYWNGYENDKNYIDYDYYSKCHDGSALDTIKYIDAFYQLEPDLSSLGFSSDVSREYMKVLSIADFEFIVSNKYTYEKIKPYLDIEGCIVCDIPAYLLSGLEPLDAILTVSYPFIDARISPFRTYKINEPDHILAFVKKGFGVDKSYQPDDLVAPNIPTAPGMQMGMLRKEASDALEAMSQEASKHGYHLMINSAYRSYMDQETVYNHYFSIYDPVTAASLVAVPGYSEHQLGLSVDLTCQSVVDGVYGVFGDSPDYMWTVQNAYKYGFILRYPSNKTALTGTANEPWHYRYVGVDVAREIYNNDWTLEEYILNHGFDYSLIF